MVEMAVCTCTSLSSNVKDVFKVSLSFYRERIEDQLEKEASFRQLMAHNSHDSAIDTDSLEWETEVVQFEKNRVSV